MTTEAETQKFIHWAAKPITILLALAIISILLSIIAYAPIFVWRAWQ